MTESRCRKEELELQDMREFNLVESGFGVGTKEDIA
jgi:hypothetical protein